MFSAANSVIPEWLTNTHSDLKLAAPAYALTKFSTTYEPPSSDTVPTGPATGTSDMMNYPRIRCVLELNTDMPEARRFASDTVGKWLEANKSRDGVPYTIIFVQRSLQVTAKDGSTSSVAEAESFPPPRPMGSGDAPPTYDRPPSGGRMARPGMPGSVPPRGGNTPPPTSDYAAGDALGTAPDDTQSLSKLNEVAPIVAVIRPPGASKVVVEWYAVLTPPAKEGGAQ
jgi:hypothetical protein